MSPTQLLNTSSSFLWLVLVSLLYLFIKSLLGSLGVNVSEGRRRSFYVFREIVVF
jgi:hypothetical protein